MIGPAALAIILTISVVALAIFFAANPPNPTNQILNTMVNTLTTVLVMVFSFFFGSSASSQNKDETIKQMAAPLTGTGTVTTGTVKTDTMTTASSQPAVTP